MNAVAIERTVWIDAPLERAWRAVTEPEQLTQWYAPGSPWEIPALEVGAPITFSLQPSVHNNYTPATLHARIELLEIPHRFGIRWEADPAYPETHLVTTFVLTEEKGGTRVTLVATGVEAAEETTESEAPDGWGMSMQNLKALLEGEPLPY